MTAQPKQLRQSRCKPVVPIGAKHSLHQTCVPQLRLQSPSSDTATAPYRSCHGSTREAREGPQTSQTSASTQALTGQSPSHGCNYHHILPTSCAPPAGRGRGGAAGGHRGAAGPRAGVPQGGGEGGDGPQHGRRRQPGGEPGVAELIALTLWPSHTRVFSGAVDRNMDDANNLWCMPYTLHL